MAIGTINPMNNAPMMKQPSAEDIAAALKGQNLDLGAKTPKTLAELDALIAEKEQLVKARLERIAKEEADVAQKIAELEQKLGVKKMVTPDVVAADTEKVEEEILAPVPAEALIESLKSQDLEISQHNEQAIENIVATSTQDEIREAGILPKPPTDAQVYEWMKNALHTIALNPFSRIGKKIKLAVVTGAIFVGSTGFVGTNGDGGFELESFKINNLVDRTISILPSAQREQGKRFLEKYGLYESTDTQFIPTETVTSKVALPTIDEINAEKALDDSVANVRAIEKHDAEVKAYKESIRSFSLLGTIPDACAENKNDSIFSYRSQWLNDEGFVYIPGPNLGQRKQNVNVKFTDVIGVGHFLLDASLFGNHTFSMNANKGFLREAHRKNEYVPCFKYIDPSHVRLQYKRAQETTPEDIIVSPLRQFKFSEIRFDAHMQADGFNTGVWTNPTTRGTESKLLFKSRDGYNRFSGGSVVFIFNDKYGNQIVRDFAGTNRQIENEGKQIMEQFGVSADDITLGYHDVGSFSAKPKAFNGVLKPRQWAGYHSADYTGGALLIPTSVLQ